MEVNIFMLKIQIKKQRRHGRVRAKLSGTKERPRLCVFRSSRHIYAQLIDDSRGMTLLSAGAQEDKSSKSSAPGDLKNKEKKAYLTGKKIAEAALANKIKEVVFDRGGYKYHGRVKALAQGARDGGLKF